MVALDVLLESMLANPPDPKYGTFYSFNGVETMADNIQRASSAVKSSRDHLRRDNTILSKAHR